MTLIDRIHAGYIHKRRVRILAQRLASWLAQSFTVLDVGCGDGLVSALILDARPDLQIRGIDVLVRGQTHIPVQLFDGRTIPCADGAFDAVMFLDVLHHTDDPMILLREARRVARRDIIIKDHTRNGLFAGATLRFMDYIGNVRHGVALPYNYWTRDQWRRAFDQLGLAVPAWEKDLHLYPAPASWIFGRSLHFLARLQKQAPPS